LLGTRKGLRAKSSYQCEIECLRRGLDVRPNPRQGWFASPVGVRPSSARGGTVFGGSEVQVANDFIAAAKVRRMIDAVDHRHVGKIKRAHAFLGTRR
jgi:hypothetical protein